jgi:hypothetical protein
MPNPQRPKLKPLIEPARIIANCYQQLEEFFRGEGVPETEAIEMATSLLYGEMGPEGCQARLEEMRLALERRKNRPE